MNHIGEIAQLITAIVLAFNCWQSWRNGRKIEQVHLATNSLTDRLVETTRAGAYQAGIKEEKENPSGLRK